MTESANVATVCVFIMWPKITGVQSQKKISKQIHC